MTPPDETPEDALLTAATAYLQKQGVRLLVIGGIQVQHRPNELRFNHELVIKFTGSVPELAADS